MIKLLGSVKIKDFKRISCLLILLTIIIGVCALLLLFSINEAGKNEILKNIKKEGNGHLLSLVPELFTQDGKESGILSHNDITLLKNRVPQVEEIALWDFKNISGVKIEQREYPPEGFSYAMTPMISGITPEFRKVMDIELKDGRFINETDLIYKRRVCVVGGSMYERLGKGKIIGKTLIAKNRTEDGAEEDVKFTIIGVIQKKMPLFASLPDRAFMSVAPILFNTPNKFSDKIEELQAFQKQQKVISSLAMNDSIYIPWTVWMDLVSSSSLPPYTLVCIKVKIPEGEGVGKFVKDEENIVKSEEEIHSGCEDCDYSFLDYRPEKIKEVCDKMRKVLKERYGDDKSFVFSYDGSFIDEIEMQISESNKLLGIVAVITLLLSGIILTSMMLLSVHKRVNEIGVRRAFGARRRDIFLQFLAEGAILYSIGIAIGIVAGSLVSYLIIVKVLSWDFSIPIQGIIISSVFVFLTGILSSLYPAIRASRIQPAVAVRYE